MSRWGGDVSQPKARRTVNETELNATITILRECFFFSGALGSLVEACALEEGTAALGSTESLTVSEQKKAHGTSQTTRRKKDAMAGTGATR